MDKKLLYALALGFCCITFSCSSDENGPGTGWDDIPEESLAGPSPIVDPAESNVNIPNVGFSVDGNVINMNMTGIYNPQTRDWLDLYGTSINGQNIWVEIDGKPRSILVEKNTSRVSRATTQVDVCFLVDNSGSMSEEADLLAAEIQSWSTKLEAMFDLKLGCVGYDGGWISGALDMDTPDKLYDFLNREGYTGTDRTYGFEDGNAETLVLAAANYETYGECGGAALHFADENFAFRSGANRLYVNFTDEPNQPGGESYKQFSVESVASQDDWKVWQGPIHTVFSGGDYYTETYSWRDLYYEKPWLMSDYTGGISILDAPANFEGVTLDGLLVTGALENSNTLKFRMASDLKSGLHTVKVTILTPDNSVKSVREFIDVDFSK